MSDVPEPTPPRVAPPLPPPVARATRLRDLYDDEDDRPRRRSRSGVGWVRSEGVLPRAKVRFACFLVLTLSLLAAGVLMILAVWEAAPSGVAWKAVATLAIIAGLMAGFTVLNEMFGPSRAESDAESDGV